MFDVTCEEVGQQAITDTSPKVQGPKGGRQKLLSGFFPLRGGGALWAKRGSYENAKVSKKLRLIAQNSGHVARRPEVSIEILLS